MSDNYLMHWRTKGSKNGQRLYQYKDGSLTPLGREHYGVGPPRNSSSTLSKWAKTKAKETSQWVNQKKEQRAIAKAEKAKTKVTANDKLAKVQNMSDAELQKEIARMQLEQQYRNLAVSLYPQKITAQGIMKDLITSGKDIIAKSLKDAFSQKFTSFVNAQLGVETQTGKKKNDTTSNSENKSSNADSSPAHQNTEKYKQLKLNQAAKQSAYDKAKNRGDQEAIAKAKRELDEANVEFEKFKSQLPKK